MTAPDLNATLPFDDGDAAGPSTLAGVVDPTTRGSHLRSGPGTNYGQPSGYDGPTVADLPPLVNPQAGTIGAPGHSPNPAGPTVDPSVASDVGTP